MRAMYLLVALALLAAVCDASPFAASSIMAEAHTCCSIGACSAEQKAALRSRSEMYDGSDAQSTRKYVELALSGSGCTSGGRSKRAVGDYVIASCDSTPIDVQNGPVTLSCTLNVRLVAGIASTSFYAYTYINGTYYKSVSSSSYYLENNSTSYSRPYTLTLPQYSPDGVYTVIGSVWSSGYVTYLSNSTTFKVSKTKNDASPPTLTSFGPSMYNLNDDNKVFTFSAFDDLTGVASMNFYCSNGSNSVASGSYYSPNGGAGLLSVSASSTLYLYAGVVSGTTCSLSIYLYDAIGIQVSLSSVQLARLGITSTLTFVANDCPAGSARPYNTTGACTTCPQGTYAKAGSFRCATCQPGTSSGVSGASSCTPCPAGQSGIGASWACSYCTPGTYTYNAGNYFCRPCSPGQNVSYIGATYCGYCPAGTYSTGGATTCTLCPPGTFSTGFGSSCTRCAPGTFTSVSGSTYCSPCLSGTYSGLGQTSCTNCPAPRVMSSAGSGSQLNCYQ